MLIHMIHQGRIQEFFKGLTLKYNYIFKIRHIYYDNIQLNNIQLNNIFVYIYKLNTILN